MSEELIQAAKAVLSSHEDNLLEGDLDAIMRNMADDVVFVAPGAPPLAGTDACRELYVDLLEMGSWDLGHEYHGGEVAGECVVLHGIARGELIPAEGPAEAVANSFLLVLRPDPSGSLKLWRAAFGPSGE